MPQGGLRHLGEDAPQPRLQDAGGRQAALAAAVRPGVHRLPHGRLRHTAAASRTRKDAVAEDVGCESCHGPGQRPRHGNPNEQGVAVAHQPLEGSGQRERRRPRRSGCGSVDQFCQKCHDIDNDVTWTHNGLDKKWPRSPIRPMPKNKALVPYPGEPGRKPPVGEPCQLVGQVFTMPVCSPQASRSSVLLSAGTQLALASFPLGSERASWNHPSA